MLAPPQQAVPRTAWGTGQMGFLRGRCKMTFICCLHEPLSLLYKKMDFCARACEAAWAIWLMLRGSERENMFTSCLANVGLEQVDVIFLWWIPTAEDFDFGVAGGAET